MPQLTSQPFKKLATLLMGLLLLVALSATSPAADKPAKQDKADKKKDAQDESGFVDLFNGKNLDGWVVKSGTAKYEVEDGCIVGTTVKGSPNTFLCTEKDYGDFILEFDVLCDPRLNSGVQIRSHAYPEEKTVVMERDGKTVKRTWPAGRVHGYQVEIAAQSGHKAGGIYDEARRGWLAEIKKNSAAGKAFKDNEWNHYRVECQGDSIKTWLNGIPCVELTDSMDASGLIGLQVHQNPSDEPLQVRWKNVRIKVLE